MTKINENFLKLQDNYLFATIKKKEREFKEKNPSNSIINLGIGDVTLPIPGEVVFSMKRASEEMGKVEYFRGYGPEQGYEFLIDKIIKNDYSDRNIDLRKDEIFISDGSKCDISQIINIFSRDNKISIMDPVYPVYIDSNIMDGRTGKYLEGKYDNIVYIPCVSDNGFMPKIPQEKVDIIYLCSPNNPTGMALNKKELKIWVDYAIENNCIILFDAAYEAFISQSDIPHSIYEIEGAKKVAIEFKSFSKTAGFTGIRCSYIVIPHELKCISSLGKEIELNYLWKRHQATKFNGVSYITQRGAEAVYTKLGKKQIDRNIKYYKNNAKIIKNGLEKLGMEVYGGINSPYIWLKIPNGVKSWDFFDELLNNTGVIGIPGVGFGTCGEGYFRLSSFGTKEDTVEAIKRIRKYFNSKREI